MLNSREVERYLYYFLETKTFEILKLRRESASPCRNWTVFRLLTETLVVRAQKLTVNVERKEGRIIRNILERMIPEI